MEYAEYQKPVTVTVNMGKKLTGLGHTKFYELINNGTLKSIKVGRRRLVLFNSIEKLANGHE